MARDAVWAVVTVFRPELSLVAALGAIQDQVDGVVVVDDGSGPLYDEAMEAAAHNGAVIVRLSTNSGIAAALNRGIRAALDAGADAVVTFDQDSMIGDRFVDRLLHARDGARAQGLIVGPVVPEYFATVRQAHRRDGKGVLRARGIIQSGMLLDRETIERVGGMFEPLFIDLVDTEYELRCLERGLAAVAAEGLRLDHRLGARYARRGRFWLPGVPHVMTLSDPFRYFYRARNRTLIDRRYLLRQTPRILRDSAIDAVYFAVVWAIARPRRSMWILLRAGRRAGRRGSGGRIPADLESIAAAITWAADRID